MTLFSRNRHFVVKKNISIFEEKKFSKEHTVISPVGDSNLKKVVNTLTDTGTNRSLEKHITTVDVKRQIEVTPLTCWLWRFLSFRSVEFSPKEAPTFY